MSEPEVLYEWTEADRPDIHWRLSEDFSESARLDVSVQEAPYYRFRYKGYCLRACADELMRLAATVKALREERAECRAMLIRFAVIVGQLSAEAVIVRQANELIARLASPSIPAVSAEEE